MLCLRVRDDVLKHLEGLIDYQNSRRVISGQLTSCFRSRSKNACTRGFVNELATILIID